MLIAPTLASICAGLASSNRAVCAACIAKQFKTPTESITSVIMESLMIHEDVFISDDYNNSLNLFTDGVREILDVCEVESIFFQECASCCAPLAFYQTQDSIDFDVVQQLRIRCNHQAEMVVATSHLNKDIFRRLVSIFELCSSFLPSVYMDESPPILFFVNNTQLIHLARKYIIYRILMNSYGHSQSQTDSLDELITRMFDELNLNSKQRKTNAHHEGSDRAKVIKIGSEEWLQEKSQDHSKMIITEADFADISLWDANFLNEMIIFIQQEWHTSFSDSWTIFHNDLSVMCNKFSDNVMKMAIETGIFPADETASKEKKGFVEDHFPFLSTSQAVIALLDLTTSASNTKALYEKTIGIAKVLKGFLILQKSIFDFSNKIRSSTLKQTKLMNNLFANVPKYNTLLSNLKDLPESSYALNNMIERSIQKEKSHTYSTEFVNNNFLNSLTSTPTSKTQEKSEPLPFIDQLDSNKVLFSLDVNLLIQESKLATLASHMADLDPTPPLNHITQSMIDSSLSAVGISDTSYVLRTQNGISLFDFPDDSMPLFKSISEATLQEKFDCLSKIDIQPNCGSVAQFFQHPSVDSNASKFHPFYHPLSNTVQSKAYKEFVKLWRLFNFNHFVMRYTQSLIQRVKTLKDISSRSTSICLPTSENIFPFRVISFATDRFYHPVSILKVYDVAREKFQQHYYDFEHKRMDDYYKQLRKFYGELDVSGWVPVPHSRISRTHKKISKHNLKSHKKLVHINNNAESATERVENIEGENKRDISKLSASSKETADSIKLVEDPQTIFAQITIEDELKVEMDKKNKKSSQVQENSNTSKKGTKIKKPTPSFSKKSEEIYSLIRDFNTEIITDLKLITDQYDFWDLVELISTYIRNYVIVQYMNIPNDSEDGATFFSNEKHIYSQQNSGNIDPSPIQPDTTTTTVTSEVEPDLVNQIFPIPFINDLFSLSSINIHSERLKEYQHRFLRKSLDDETTPLSSTTRVFKRAVQEIVEERLRYEFDPKAPTPLPAAVEFDNFKQWGEKEVIKPWKAVSEDIDLADLLLPSHSKIAGAAFTQMMDAAVKFDYSTSDNHLINFDSPVDIEKIETYVKNAKVDEIQYFLKLNRDPIPMNKIPTRDRHMEAAIHDSSDNQDEALMKINSVYYTQNSQLKTDSQSTVEQNMKIFFQNHLDSLQKEQHLGLNALDEVIYIVHILLLRHLFKLNLYYQVGSIQFDDFSDSGMDSWFRSLPGVRAFDPLVVSPLKSPFPLNVISYTLLAVQKKKGPKQMSCISADGSNSISNVLRNVQQAFKGDSVSNLPSLGMFKHCNFEGASIRTMVSENINIFAERYNSMVDIPRKIILKYIIPFSDLAERIQSGVSKSCKTHRIREKQNINSFSLKLSETDSFFNKDEYNQISTLTFLSRHVYSIGDLWSHDKFSSVLSELRFRLLQLPHEFWSSIINFELDKYFSPIKILQSDPLVNQRYELIQDNIRFMVEILQIDPSEIFRGYDILSIRPEDNLHLRTIKNNIRKWKERGLIIKRAHNFIDDDVSKSTFERNFQKFLHEIPEFEAKRLKMSVNHTRVLFEGARQIYDFRED